MDIRKLGDNKYSVNGEVVEFTSDELKEGTKNVIESYIFGENAVDIDFEDRAWKDTKYNPPTHK